ncbi:MAG: 4Fe-4S dicluster domain-containing protein [Methanomassiliicoccus sp.]|nr:4Fe-4S dicluster domain-containing protein [Methanomassiliicoccus sp.]
MAVRKIIQIDESKCDGCGRCVEACAEGAVEIREGKAKVVRDLFCDGFGACLGECPRGALSIVEREAEPFDEEAAKMHVATTRKASECVCPSAIPMVMKPAAGPITPAGEGSELTNWPIQMRLVSPDAPYFKDARLLLAGDCTAFAFASMHPSFIRDRTTVIGCPKLDDNGEFIEKLAAILSSNAIKDVTVIHMEVPCCGQMNRLVNEARKRAGSKVPVASYTISRTGVLMKDEA